MTTRQFITQLRALDVKLWVDGERLRYSAAPGVITAELRSELTQRKGELVTWIQQAMLDGRAEAPPIEPFPRDGSVVVSFAQQRLWILDQLFPNNPSYNMPWALRLQGPLDRDALQRSLDQLVDRHETLRTTFGGDSDTAVQVIADPHSVEMFVVDLTDRPVGEGEAEARRLAVEEANCPFDLSRGPLFRARLLRLAEQDHVLLLTMHHIVSDGWSTGVFNRELSALYKAFCLGQPSPLRELPVQYGDFAVWQRQWLQGDVLAEQLDYWKKTLAGMATLQLPTDRPRPAVQEFEGAYERVILPKDLCQQIEALNQSEGTTLFMTLLAAFATLLHRYSGQDDIAVGTPIANRNRSETEGLIGFFVNSLVMRTDVSGDPNFRELLGRVRRTALDAYAHQDLPFEKLVEELEPERDLSRNPLFQVMFAVQNAPAKSLELRELEISALGGGKPTTGFDLEAHVWPVADGLHLTFIYSTALFDSSTVRRMLSHFQTLLEGLVSDPDRPILQVPLMDHAERNRVVVEWNQTVTDYPRQATIQELFEHQVQQHPETTALRFEGGDLTYGQLNARANQLAHYLHKLGVGPETMVGICAERSVEMVVGILGILKAGGAYVPLDPTYPQERLAFMISDSRVPVLLTVDRLRGTFAGQTVTVVCLDSDHDEIVRNRADNPVRVASADNLAYVIYTSGSTGRPKGVMVAHRALCNHMLWMQSVYPLGETDATPQKYSFSFDAATLEIFAPLLAGARLVIAQPGAHLDHAYILRLIEEQKITAIDVTPSFLQVLLSEPGHVAWRHLRRITCGGEAMSVELQDRVFALREDLELANLYGPTEAAIDATFWTCQRNGKHLSVPIGGPIANTSVYVLDRCSHPVPIGVSGELYIGGVGLARGYMAEPALTAARFIPDPFRKDGRLYRTGDLVRYLPDGKLEFLGRVDNQVKIRGFRIELGEIESVLQQHPEVQDTVVLGRDDGLFVSDDGRRIDDESLLQGMLALAAEEAEELWADLQSLSDDEAEFLFDFESNGDVRSQIMFRKSAEMEIFLKICDDKFVKPPRESQRNWVLQRALDEFADDLKHLDETSKRFVTGSERPQIADDWRSSRAEYDGSQLVIEGQQVMQDWERPLMKAMVDVVTETHGDVLEVGFGMGISATDIQERGVSSHSIIECNADVVAAFQQWRVKYADRDIRLVRGRWQDVVDELELYDGVFFDAYPLSEAEFQETVINSITFADVFIPTAATLLRPGGVLTYYSNEIDSFSRRHQRLLFKYFSTITLSVVNSLKPPDDCNYWWADSMAVVKAIK